MWQVLEVFDSIKQLETIEDCEFLFPSIKYCTDNGAMIALAGIERFERNKLNKLNFKPRPRWPLDKNAVFMKGKRGLLEDKTKYRIGIIGAGAWGTALANIISKKEKVILWAKEKSVCDNINKSSENKRYLPKIKLSKKIKCTTSILDVAKCEFYF